jgi:hypothetical protein
MGGLTPPARKRPQAVNPGSGRMCTLEKLAKGSPRGRPRRPQADPRQARPECQLRPETPPHASKASQTSTATSPAPISAAIERQAPVEPGSLRPIAVAVSYLQGFSTVPGQNGSCSLLRRVTEAGNFCYRHRSDSRR